MLNRVFTLEEARSALPKVRERLGRAMLISTRMHSFRGELEMLAERGIYDAGSPLGTVYVEHLVALQECLGEIQDMGCVVESVEDGHVEFPYLLEGREAYLCWKYDEADIGYWREADAGFSERNPIEGCDLN